MTNTTEFTENVDALVSQLVGVAKGIKTAIEEDETTLATLKSDIDDHEQYEKAAFEARTFAEKEFEREKQAYKDSIEVFRKEKLTLTTEVGVLVTRKADLKLDNAKLEQQNKHYKDYEEKAHKVLSAKDAELMERQRIIEQQETFKPQPKTILPPIDMI